MDVGELSRGRGDVAGRDPAPPSRAPRPGRSLTIAFVIGGGLLCALIWWAARAGLIDDAYITLAYAKNFAVDLHWGLTPQQVSNTATSPGNVLLLAAATALLRVFGGVHPVVGLGVVCVLCGVVFGWAWARIVRATGIHWLFAALGAALVLLNPFVLSAIGLEVLPIAAVLALLLAAASERRPVAFGAFAGLAVLIRLDLVVLVVLLALAAPGIRNRLHLAVPAALVIGLPWYAWAWFYFGSAVPDTFVIKTLQQSFGGITFADGPLAMFRDLPVLVAVAFAPPLFGALLAVGAAVAAPWRPARLRGALPAVALGLGGIAYYGVYSTLHVPPYHWYYVPPIVSATIAGAVLAGRLATRGAGHEATGFDRRVAVPAGAGLFAATAAALVLAVGHGVPWATTQVFGNWATAPDYARVGTEIGQRVGDAVVRNPGEIGTLAYFCDCAMVNDFTDRGVIVPLVQQRIADSGRITNLLLRANYYNLDRTRTPLPADYELRYDPGPGSGPDVWQVSAPGRGVGHLTLVPVGPAPGTPG